MGFDFNEYYAKAIAPITINGREVKSFSQPKTVFNIFLEPAYDDWRRYMSNYYLYLPFVGIVSLDSERYINHYFSCKLTFDIRTGSMKYDLLSDNVVMESHSGQIRVNFPVTAASPYAASLNKVVSSVEAVGSGVSMATGNLGAAKGLANGLMDAVKPVQKKSTGGFTPSVNIFDSLHVYLLSETPEIYYGDGIQERYGYPDNQFGTIGSFSGYVEIADAELQTRATETEQNEILTLLMQGVII